ncbi:MAG: hypothetical protein AABW87_00475, partial [Nanoarchaeota archaeon]
MEKRWFILVFLVVLAGCAGLIRGQQKDTTSGAFVGGTQGISLSFIEGEPPAGVLDNNQEAFLITLMLRNEGEFTVPVGRIIASLSGVSQESFNLKSLDAKSDFALEKKSKARDATLPGGQEELSFREAKYKPDLPADFSIDLRADICYDYQTEAVTSVCLRKNVLERDEIEDNCRVDNTNIKAENSGGPIQISNVVERPSGNSKVRVSFDVSNKGIGVVYEPNTFSKSCSGNDDKKDALFIEVTSTSNKYKITCSKFGSSNKGIIRLVNGAKNLNCEIDTSGLQEVSFTDFLLIRAKYMYRDAVSVPITIENAE